MDRLFVASLLVVTYAVLATVSATGAPAFCHAAILPLGLLLLAVGRATRHAERDDAARARVAIRVVAAALSVSVVGFAALSYREGRLMLALGTAATSLAGAYATAHMPAEASLTTRAARRSSHAATLSVIGVAWCTAVVAAAWLAFAEPGSSLVLARAAQSAFVGAALVSLSISTATSLLELRRRKLELGAADRLRSFATLSLTLLLIALLAGGLGLVPLVPLLALACSLSGLTAALTAVSKRPETVGRIATQLVVLALLAVLPALGMAAFAKRDPAQAALAVALAAGFAALAGLFAPRAAERMMPRAEPWTRAFDAAQRAAAYPDPEPALERALFELAGLSVKRLESPCLFRFEPATVTTVDVAGYAHSEPVEIPETVAKLAKSEPECVLSVEVLRSVAVQQPEVRPALAWLSDRHLAAVAVVLDGDLPIGMLGLPLGDRVLPLTLAEVRALGSLTRVLGAQIAASAKLARSLVREAQATATRSAAEAKLAIVEGDLAAEQHRGEALTQALAARALTAVYAPPSRLAKEALERLGERGSALALLAPAGTDALPFVAIYHLASPRKSAALYVVDGMDKSRSDLEHWRSATESPFLRARGGTLALLDPQLLPKLVQAYIGAAFDDRIGLAVVVPKTLDVLVAEGSLDERLADRLDGATVVVPALAERSEDLRALVLFRLTRLGMNLRGRPLGIEPSALALLAEHDFPGNDAELESILVRAAKDAEGDVIKRRDLLALGFSPERPKRQAG